MIPDPAAEFRSNTQREKVQLGRRFQVGTNSTLCSSCFQSALTPSPQPHPHTHLPPAPCQSHPGHLDSHPGTAGGSIPNCWSSQILLPSSLQMCRHTRTHIHTNTPVSPPVTTPLPPTHSSSSSSSPRSLFATAAASWLCPEPSGGFPAPSPLPCSQEGKAGKGGK